MIYKDELILVTTDNIIKSYDIDTGKIKSTQDQINLKLICKNLLSVDCYFNRRFNNVFLGDKMSRIFNRGKN